MLEKLENFQNKRKMIFRETARLAYHNQLQQNIDNLPEKFISNPADNRERELIKNEIMMAMGLNPSARYDTELASEVVNALNLQEIEEPLVAVNNSICKQCQKENQEYNCNESCIYDDKQQGLLIESGRCISCGKCIPDCPLGAISDKIEFIPMVKYLKENIPVYANVAPAIVGQFGEEITPGMLRSALKSIGFTDMVEVALFADILTLYEANEYLNLVKTKNDFLITSCCCPVWINLLTKNYPELCERLTRTVSPMIASGRVIKTIFPEAITVFIGPCVAKKAEAKHPELKGSIDYVLTFNELDEIFKALEIDLNKMNEDQKSQSSYGGRIYGRTGGVSKSVELTLAKIAPDKKKSFKPYQANGVGQCKELLDQLKNNEIKANFIEGMGCEGGCVGGPKRNIDVAKGTEFINKYGNEAQILNPIENQNVAYILKHLSTINKKKTEQISEIDLDSLLLRE